MQRLSQFNFGDISVFRLVTGPIEENAYLIRATDASGILVDPGDDAEDVLELVRRSNAKPNAMVLTHAHFDHIGAVQAVREALKIPVLLHPDARGQYNQAHLAAQRWNLPFAQPAPPDADLQTGPLEFGALKLEGLFTPGHAPGHVSLSSNTGFVISGDALFRGSIGRTDLPGCDHALLIASIREHLLTLPPETVVFSGHGTETTIGREISSNPFLR